MRIEELQTDKAVAEKDYREAIGKLRYAINLQRSKTIASSPIKEQVPPQNGASTSSVALNLAQQDRAGTSGGQGLGAVGDPGAGRSDLTQQGGTAVVAAAGNEEVYQPGVNSDKENSEAPDKVPNQAQNFQLPQAALEMHRKIASATAHLLGQQLDEVPGAEECPVCNEYMLNKCAARTLQI